MDAADLRPQALLHTMGSYCRNLREALELIDDRAPELEAGWIEARLAEADADREGNRLRYGSVLRERLTVTGIKVVEGAYAHELIGGPNNMARQWVAYYHVWVSRPGSYGNDRGLNDQLGRMFAYGEDGRAYADALVAMGGGEQAEG